MASRRERSAALITRTDARDRQVVGVGEEWGATMLTPPRPQQCTLQFGGGVSSRGSFITDSAGGSQLSHTNRCSNGNPLCSISGDV